MHFIQNYESQKEVLINVGISDTCQWGKCGPLQRLTTRPPGGRSQNQQRGAVGQCQNIHSCKISGKSVDFRGNSMDENWRTEASPPATYGSLRDPSSSAEPPSKREPPRFARWLIKFGKSVNVAIWQVYQITEFTFFLNLSFPNIWEMKQKDTP